MHSSGSITRKFGPSWKQSTGHTSTQSVYLHLMQFSVTTKGMGAIRDETLPSLALPAGSTRHAVCRALRAACGCPDSLPADPSNPTASNQKGEQQKPVPAGHGFLLFGAPYGIRTRVLALRGPRPGPLDEGSMET